MFGRVLGRVPGIRPNLAFPQQTSVEVFKYLCNSLSNYFLRQEEREGSNS